MNFPCSPRSVNNKNIILFYNLFYYYYILKCKKIKNKLIFKINFLLFFEKMYDTNHKLVSSNNDSIVPKVTSKVY